MTDLNLGRTEDHPVPIGGTVDVGYWRIGVSDSILDATDEVLAIVDFNQPPPPGSQFVLVELTGVYQGQGLSQPVFTWRLVSDNSEFFPDGVECGIIPNSIYDVREVGNGAEFTASICLEVPTDQMSDDVLLKLGLPDGEGEERFFALS